MRKDIPSFADWLRTVPPEQRTLANAFAAGQHALLHAEVLPPEKDKKKRTWRPVSPTYDKPNFLVRGLANVWGEVRPVLTDGDKVVVKTKNGRQVQTFLDNLYLPEGPRYAKSSTSSPRRRKKKLNPIAAEFFGDLDD